MRRTSLSLPRFLDPLPSNGGHCPVDNASALSEAREREGELRPAAARNSLPPSSTHVRRDLAHCRAGFLDWRLGRLTSRWRSACGAGAAGPEKAPTFEDRAPVVTRMLVQKRAAQRLNSSLHRHELRCQTATPHVA